MKPSPPRSVDRDVRRLADRVGFALLWAWIVSSLLFVPAWLGFPVVGMVLFVVGLVTCWQAAQASTHPVTTIGIRKEVTVEPVTEPGHDCAVCGRPVSDGERRRYVTRRILFGTTVAVPEWGENYYCAACADDPALERDGFERRRERSPELEEGRS